jgi:hypothetical protein
LNVTNLVIADEQMRAKLCKTHEPLLVCAADGTVLGYFTPTPSQQLDLQPKISEEELLRREEDITAPRHTTAEVIAKLRAL